MRSHRMGQCPFIRHICLLGHCSSSESGREEKKGRTSYSEVRATDRCQVIQSPGTCHGVPNGQSCVTWLKGSAVGTNVGQLTRLQVFLRPHETVCGNLATCFQCQLLQDKLRFAAAGPAPAPGQVHSRCSINVLNEETLVDIRARDIPMLEALILSGPTSGPLRPELESWASLIPLRTLPLSEPASSSLNWRSYVSCRVATSAPGSGRSHTHSEFSPLAKLGPAMAWAAEGDCRPPVPCFRGEGMLYSWGKIWQKQNSTPTWAKRVINNTSF